MTLDQILYMEILLMTKGSVEASHGSTEKEVEKTR
jgi:hypothetical protein